MERDAARHRPQKILRFARHVDAMAAIGEFDDEAVREQAVAVRAVIRQQVGGMNDEDVHV